MDEQAIALDAGAGARAALELETQQLRDELLSAQVMLVELEETRKHHEAEQEALADAALEDEIQAEVDSVNSGKQILGK